MGWGPIIAGGGVGWGPSSTVRGGGVLSLQRRGWGGGSIIAG